MMRQVLFTALLRCSKQLPESLECVAEQPWWRWTGSVRDVKTQANQIRSGQVLEVDGRLAEVIKSVHGAGQGRQLGNVQIALRDPNTEKKYHVRHRSYDTVERVMLDTQDYQVLYVSGDIVHLMDENYEQLEVDKSIFGDRGKWLRDGLGVTVDHLISGEAIAGALPRNIVAEVEQTGSQMSKGDGAGSTSTMTCRLIGGAEIKVPGHIKIGEKIVVNTDEGTFVRRA